MERLDLSMNHLSGKIPASFTGLNFLSSFNVSYNNLGGRIPSGTQLQSFNASAFEGNQLCGAPLPNKCQTTEGADAPDMSTPDADNKEHQIPWFYVSVALGYITGFWGVCGPLVLMRKWRCAYYHFLDKVQDSFHVMIAECMASMRRKFV
ncbi:putative leucine-rich repeat domain, L domain-containing protein [Rosa chinensis]|uniref:Putative leucine-rich repeat domain, L domain-containing protein n=1 Tax=Rosa chinensis TaxID=74649 RepID=A0A2P6QNE3_ROSCH|nr:receptor-like protein EIX2 [Rosa chinensis]PRQ35696.1 putative leucine-rich repeat domain, L domain-containing protein [Rosa chinensis]